MNSGFEELAHDKGYSTQVLGAASEVHGNRMVVLVLFCFVGFMGSSCVVAFGITAEKLATRLQLSVIESAMLTSAALLSSAVAAVPVSLATRVWGGRILCCVLCGIGATSLLILAALLTWVADLRVLYGLFVVLGLMQGMAVATVVAGLVHLSWWFPDGLQGSVAGAFLFAFSLGPGVFGAFAFAAIDAMTIGGFFLLWSLLVYAAAVTSLFIADPPYTQLLRLVKKKGLLVETLPGESSRSLVDLSQSNVSQSQLIAVCRDAIGQEVFPENAFLRDLRLSLTRLENWCIIGIASITLGCLLSLTVWIPTFYLGVFHVESNVSGYILMGYNFAAALGCLGGGLLTDKLNVWITCVAFLVATILSFLTLGVSTVYGVSIGASIFAGFCSSAANVAAYKLLFVHCNQAASGTIGWSEAGGNLVAFALPLIYGAIVDSGSVDEKSIWLRVGMAVPAALLVASIGMTVVVYFKTRHNSTVTPMIGIVGGTHAHPAHPANRGEKSGSKSEKRIPPKLK